MSNTDTCDCCKKEGVRYKGTCCPESWMFFAVPTGGEELVGRVMVEKEYIVSVCSQKCAMRIWNSGPGKLDLVTGLISVTPSLREHLIGRELKIYKSGRCPDCEGPLVEGPSGGFSVNWGCDGVGESRFNDEGPFGVTRISTARCWAKFRDDTRWEAVEICQPSRLMRLWLWVGRKMGWLTKAEAKSSSA